MIYGQKIACEFPYVRRFEVCWCILVQYQHRVYLLLTANEWNIYAIAIRCRCFRCFWVKEKISETYFSLMRNGIDDVVKFNASFDDNILQFLSNFHWRNRAFLSWVDFIMIRVTLNPRYSLLPELSTEQSKQLQFLFELLVCAVSKSMRRCYVSNFLLYFTFLLFKRRSICYQC